MNKEELNKINQLIDKMVDDLKKELISGAEYKNRYTPGSFWDRVKRFWVNAFWDPNSSKNPYVYKNKFGALGEKAPEENKTEKKEEAVLSLRHYCFLNEQYNLLEKSILNLNENLDSSENIKNLKLFRIIDSWASNFKKEIEKLLLSVSDTVVEPEAEPATRLERMPRNPREEESSSSSSAPAAAAPVAPTAPATPTVVAAAQTAKKRGRKIDQIWSPENGWVGLGYVVQNNEWNIENEMSEKKSTRMNRVKKLTKNIFEEEEYFFSFLQDFHQEINNLSQEEKEKLKNANFESWIKVFEEKIDRLGDDDLFFGGLDSISI